jgi:hypothetical protein
VANINIGKKYFYIGNFMNHLLKKNWTALLIAVVAISTTVLITTKNSIAQTSSVKEMPGHQLDDPRTPLTFHDSGVYDGWNEYWLRDDFPFNVLIVQAWTKPDGAIDSHGQEGKSTWGQWLQRARAKNKRVIADITPKDIKTAKDPLAYYQKALDTFMKGVDENQLFAISLSEENIYWNGHEELLKKVYAYAKEKYHVPVYQWYSPYARPPGFGWPNLPADGWITDEYAHAGPSYETFIRSYAIHQLPLIQIVWAEPMMTTFDWATKGDPAFDWQIAICRKYNIPAAYFLWEGHGNIWGWSDNAGPLSKSVYLRAVEAAQRATSTNPTPYQQIWDSIPTLQPQSMVYAENHTASFEEDFLQSGGLTAKGAVIQGFRDVRWNGGPLELRPREKSSASATLLYPLHSKFPLNDVRVELKGKVIPQLQGSIAVATSIDGQTWSPEHQLDSTGILTTGLANQDNKPIQNLWIRISLTGKIEDVGDIPASIDSFTVSGHFSDPAERQVSLYAIPGKPMQWQSTPDSSLLFTSDIKNRKELEVSGNGIGTHGVAGHANHVVLYQKFISNVGLNLNEITSINTADQKNFGATNTLGISLDGKNILLQKSTSGIAKASKLSLELADDPRFQNVKEFWIYLEMSNLSGVKTGTTNKITGLTIQAAGYKALQK